ncbi:MAG TPA: hypothetical protein VF052_06480 [Solirubrobacterales bacterium]
MRLRRSLAGLGTAALLAVAAGCGDESGQEETTEAVSIPSPTSPIATGTTTNGAPAAPAKTKKQDTQTTGGSSAGCSVPANYQKFEFAGTDCASALAIADAWEANPNQCNTIDDPQSPEGYKRSCSVEGYTCEAKRDVHSDGRFVSCTQGGASVRFTWFPN